MFNRRIMHTGKTFFIFCLKQDRSKGKCKFIEGEIADKSMTFAEYRWMKSNWCSVSYIRDSTDINGLLKTTRKQPGFYLFSSKRF